jgi:hypothetical protein
MPLTCRKFFPILLLATLACSDTTAPVMVPAYFGLANINGHSLPAPSRPSLDPAPTVLSAYIFLDASGKATMAESRREIDGTISQSTYVLDYKINGDQIEIGSFSPCGETANCIGTYKGTVSNNALSLTIAVVSIDGPIVYNYQRAFQIPV